MSQGRGLGRLLSTALLCGAAILAVAAGGPAVSGPARGIRSTSTSTSGRSGPPMEMLGTRVIERNRAAAEQLAKQIFHGQELSTADLCVLAAASRLADDQMLQRELSGKAAGVIAKQGLTRCTGRQLLELAYLCKPGQPAVLMGIGAAGEQRLRDVRQSTDKSLPELINLIELGKVLGQDGITQASIDVLEQTLTENPRAALLPPSELMRLAESCRQQPRLAASLSKMITEQYIGSGIVRSLTVSELVDLARFTAISAPDASEKVAGEVVATIRVRAVRLDPNGARTLARAVQGLTRDPSLVDAVLQGAFGACVTESSEATRNEVRAVLLRDDQAQTRPADLKLQAIEQNLGWPDFELAARALVAMYPGDTAGTEKMLQVGLTRARMAPDAKAMDVLSFLLKQVHPAIDAARNQEYTDALVSLLTTDPPVPDEVYAAVGTCCDFKTTLQKTLASEVGTILPMAKVCAWAAKDRQQCFVLLAGLKKAAQNQTGDSSATMELAQAYLIGRQSDRHRRLDGQGHMDLAMAQAVSPQVKLLCLQELATAAVLDGEPDDATRVVNSAVSGLPDSAQPQVKDILTSLESTKLNRDQHQRLASAKRQWAGFHELYHLLEQDELGGLNITPRVQALTAFKLSDVK